MDPRGIMTICVSLDSSLLSSAFDVVGHDDSKEVHNRLHFKAKYLSKQRKQG